MKIYILCDPRVYELHSRLILRIKNPTKLYNFFNLIMPVVPAIIDGINVQIDRVKI